MQAFLDAVRGYVYMPRIKPSLKCNNHSWLRANSRKDKNIERSGKEMRKKNKPWMGKKASDTETLV